MKNKKLVYEEVEEEARKVLSLNARKFYRQFGMTYDEAFQEGRYALFLGLKKYDSSRGNIVMFANILIRRHFLKMWVGHRRQVRHPHAVVVDEAGRRKMIPVSFIVDKEDSDSDFWDFVSGSIPQRSAVNEFGEVSGRLQTALVDRLSECDRNVFMCRIDPPRGLRTIMCDNCATEPTILMIGEYLGIGKNGVDWALRRIRNTAMDLISRQFSELSDFPVVKGYASGHP